MDKDTVIIVLLSVLLALHLAPRPYVRHLRKCASRFVFWQWKKMSHASAVLYWWLYEKLNGNNNDV